MATTKQAVENVIAVGVFNTHTETEEADKFLLIAHGTGEEIARAKRLLDHTGATATAMHGVQ